MEIQLFGAIFGSPCASTVDTRTMGPGSMDGCQSALPAGKAILAGRWGPAPDRTLALFALVIPASVCGFQPYRQGPSS